ncbi:MAG: thioredoxin [bacterium]
MIELTDQNFEEEITRQEKPVLVDFFASWCAPCAFLTPILEKLEKEWQGEMVLAKVNLDEAPLAAQKFRIEKIPTTVLFWRGKAVAGFVGVYPEPLIRDWLREKLKTMEGDFEKTVKEYQDFAKRNGLRLNENREVVESLIKGLLENEKKYGQRYCPCRRVKGDPLEDAKNICPCSYRLEEIDKTGHCFCGLFFK